MRLKRREVPVQATIGLRLAHDLTRIAHDGQSDPQFRKGHVIEEKDIAEFIAMGKQHLLVFEPEKGELHAEDAASQMAEALAGQGVLLSEVNEGKLFFQARHNGMLWVDSRRVAAMNSIHDVSISTRRSFIHVSSGMLLGSVRPIPVVVDETTVRAVQLIAEETYGGRSIIDVFPYRAQQIHVITATGDIGSGRSEDQFGAVLKDKFQAFDLAVHEHTFVGDTQAEIESAILAACEAGATLICITGGMSGDPDDSSPSAVRAVATDVITHGTPINPGSLLMLAYRERTPIFGLPRAVLRHPVTSFDKLLPRILAGVHVRKKDIAALGVGGWLYE
ncbi:molybdopterin-binding protein [Alicyclobacillus fodiniaquatilis]|uniref:Molybdopterin-binding protein n=1 Tax=Alicyclobacillus fodiniaquatilis TaxID=1661150 RepID=A0ABW4JBC7_9BACL